MQRVLVVLAVFVFAGSVIHAAEPPSATTLGASALAKMPTPAYLSPAESVKLVQLAPGYHLELVLSEPDIREPVLSVFDGNGRLYVAEMRTYMQDADATGEKAPTSRVSLHWSSKGDGNFDRHSVFVDHLLLPRMILPLKDSVLIQETDTGDVFEYRDTDNDGVADEKKLFYAFEKRAGANLEHQPSGLIWSLDNWIYTTLNAERIRWTPHGAIKEPTAPNGGQWGLAQDNYGKPWFINAGGEIGPLNFQQPIVYGAFKHPAELASDFKEVFPLVGLADVQGGPPRFRPEDKTLNHITAVSGIEIFRGDSLPADLRGDVLFCEPVGRLLRRAKVEVKDGITTLRNAYEKTEFLRSTDPYFRPVNVVTGPDGTIYITDMYRGIIQEGNWTRKESYLRGVIDQYGMGGMINRGRIWRLVHDNLKPGPQPQMLNETPAQLVAHLSHPNGWWRDTAQKLLILHQDKSVIPALEQLARTSTSALARIHAIWTLEGLDALTPALTREKFKDTDTHVRVAAIRASESLVKNGNSSLAADILAQCGDSSADVTIQGMMTANFLKLPEAKSIITRSALTSPSAGVKEIAGQLLNPVGGTIGAQFTRPERQQLERGQAIFLELCFACHGIDGQGTPMEGKGTTLAPPLAGSATATGHRDAIIMALLHGIAGPINGRTYDAQMTPMGGNDDIWIASIASFVRTSFGNKSPLITTQDVARVRAAFADRKDAWTISELNAKLPKAVGNRDAWKLTTNRPAKPSDGSAAPAIGPAQLSFSATAPFVGAWLQIELPEIATLSEIRLSSANSRRNFTRAYRIEFSSDGENWGKPITGSGVTAIVDIPFKPAKAKWIRITLTLPPSPVRDDSPGAPRPDGVPENVPSISNGPTNGGNPNASSGGNGGLRPAEPVIDWTLDDVQLFQPVQHSAVTSA